MRTEESRLTYLVKLSLSGNMTPAERDELAGRMADPANAGLAKQLIDEAYHAPKETVDISEIKQEAILKAIYQADSESADEPVELPRKHYAAWLRIAAAASVILGIGFGYYFYQHNGQKPAAGNQLVKNDILPGGNKAYLTLSNGHRLTLTGMANGKIAQQAGAVIIKTADGQLVYKAGEPLPGAANNDIKYNTVETPRGGQYQLILPDGTRVWLNAASSLRYPAQFAGNERKVELTGEAYFEVVHDQAHPFRVAANGQTVEDIGTHFNINSYSDEPSVITTLLEGAVKVNEKTILKPGEQASLLLTGNIIVKTVDPYDAVAWKNGEFAFHREALSSVMRKISRWYNVGVIYDNGAVSDEKFSGTISRFGNVSKVLHMLETTGNVKFRLEGGNVRVTVQ